MSIFSDIKASAEKVNETDQLPVLPVVVDNATIINLSVAIVMIATILILIFNVTKTYSNV